MFKVAYLALKLWGRNLKLNLIALIKRGMKITPRQCDGKDCGDLTIHYTILPNNIIRCRGCTQKYWGSK